MVIEKMEGYIPKDERKKILLLSDDIRTHSGIATVAKEIVIHTAHKFNWTNIGAAINHPEKGQYLDISEETSKIAQINDAHVTIYPSDGYGNPDMLRQLIARENPDALFLITDPRYFTWLFQIENEIRKKIPIIYLNIWDDYPAPMYNKEYYESCDLLMGISKQTVNINKLVLGDKANGKIISYVPHGLNDKIFFPIDESYKNYKEFQQFKEELFQGKNYDFVAFFNSRNIRRKQVPDTIWAYKQFIDLLDENEASKCALVLHTQKVDQNGTDLPAVIENLCGDDPKYNIIFSDRKLNHSQMNWLYNCTDAQIQLTSNEGWGLSLTEALLVGNPIIANVTGGMQDQMRFEDNNGEWYVPDANVPSNHRGTYKKCGIWAFPIFPSNISIVGSVPTPYIFDDRCNPTDAARQLWEVWALDTKTKQHIQKEARKWATGNEAGFTSFHMARRIINNIETLFETWSPRKKYELLKIEDKKPLVTPHKLIY